MAAVRLSRLLRPTLVVSCLFLLWPQVWGVPPDPFENYTPPGVAIMKEDLPFIRCSVCQRLTQKLVSLLQEKRQKAPKNKPVGELQIIELTEKICDRKTIDGGWIARTDMEEDGDKIKLVEYDFDGDCRSECRTIEKACEDIMNYRDTDVAELLERPDMTQEALEEAVCHQMTDSCVEPPPPLPADRKPGEKFEKEKPKNYGKMAEELGLKPNVMHDSAEDYEIPEGLPVLPPPKHLTDPPKKKGGKKKKKKGGSSRSSSWESMSEL